MAGVLNRILSFAGIYDDSPYAAEDEYEDSNFEAVNDYVEEEPDAEDNRTLNDRLRNQGSGRGSGVRGERQGGMRSDRPENLRGAASNVVSFNPQKTQNNYVLVSAKPDRLEDAQLVCEHLKDRHVVIVNVEGLDGREAQRIVDFIGGAVFALDGEIFDITNRIFTVAPNNVDLVAIKRDPKNRGFLSFGNGGGYRG